MAKCLVLDKKDNVAVSVAPVKAGDQVDFSGGENIVAVDEVPFAHKIAIKSIPRGTRVYKYGEVIGEAIEDILAGQHVHVHNIRSLRVRR